jgi:hypothetical protein
MLRDWKKMIVLTAGIGLVGLTTGVKADQFGQTGAGTKPRTHANYSNYQRAGAGYNGYRQEQRLKVYINMRGNERFGSQIERYLQEIAGDRFKLVHRRNRADVVLGLNTSLSRVGFNQYNRKNVRDRYKKRIRNNYRHNNGLSYASYEVIKENMFMSYQVNIRVRFNGQRIKQRSFQGQVNQKRKYARNLQGLTRAGWNEDVPAPSRKIARLLAAGSVEGTRMAKRNLRQSAARDIAYKIANMRVLNKLAQNVSYQTNDRSNERPKNWKKRLIGGLIAEIAFGSHK